MANKPSNAGVIVAAIPDARYMAIRPWIVDAHVTVAYLGRYNDERLHEKALKSFWDVLSENWTYVIDCEVAGETMFWTGETDGWAHVDLVDGPLLPDLRCLVLEFLAVHDMPLDTRHGFLPHVTRRYIKNPVDQTVIHTKNRPKFTLDRLELWAGDLRYSKELT